MPKELADIAKRSKTLDELRDFLRLYKRYSDAGYLQAINFVQCDQQNIVTHIYYKPKDI